MPETSDEVSARLMAEKTARLNELHEASKKLLALLAGTRDVNELIQKGIEVLATLAQAKYVAVGVLDQHGKLSRFIHTGIQQTTADKIGKLPEGHGLLGVVVRESEVMRLEEMQQHRQFEGFPKHHPEMKSLLAVPIKGERAILGRVYLCDKIDGTPFSDDDEIFVTIFANTLGIVLMNLDESLRREKAESALRLAAKVVSHTQEGVMVLDYDGKIISLNPAFTAITGYSEEEIVGLPFHILRAERHSSESFDALLGELKAKGSWQGELWHRRKNGEAYPQWTVINAMQDNDGTVTEYVCLFTDITERKRQESRLEYLAHHDPLTQLPNRTLLNDRLQQALSSARRNWKKLALLFLDLDLFKIVNDTLGHTAGDLLLKKVAAKLQRCVRDCDTVARLGGDEFTVVLADVNDTRDVAMIAQKILDSLVEPFNLDGHEFHISASIGISLFPSDAQDIDALLKHADTAMYQAKTQGNNYQFYMDSMGVEANEQLLLEENLYHALANQEMLVYYQPKMDVNTVHIVGVKALLRWHNPQLGFVAPTDFIPVAERLGLIVPVGAWALEEACRQCVAWQKKNFPPVRITIPLSLKQFSDEGLVLSVQAAINGSGIAPELLEFEVSKRAALDDIERAVSQIETLRQLGVGVIVEDIGENTELLGSHGNASADALKLSPDFIREINAADEAHASTEALIKAARSLKIRIIAEGVENMEQLLFLRSHQCDEILGYFFSRPVSAEELERLLFEDNRKG